MFLESEMPTLSSACLKLIGIAFIFVICAHFVSDLKTHIGTWFAVLIASNILGKSFEEKSLSSIERHREIAEIAMVSNLRLSVVDITSQLRSIASEHQSGHALTQDTSAKESYWLEKGFGIIADIKSLTSVSGSQRVVKSLTDLRIALEQAMRD